MTQVGSEYSFTWTIPQCVLTLRLISLTFDVYDGNRLDQWIKKHDKPKASNNVAIPSDLNVDTAVSKVPTFLEFMSHAYFPGSFLIGPQVTYKNYLDYIDSEENFLSRTLVNFISLTQLFVAF